MYILTRNNLVIDYCSAGYSCIGSTIICESKGCIYLEANIVDTGEMELPSDIDQCNYYYEYGTFHRGEEKLAPCPFVISDTEPEDTQLLWIDTTTITGGLKYHNGTSWVHVPVAYS